ncbi:hypothetical protein [Cellulomonas sp. Marseille-Q8402]
MTASPGPPPRVVAAFGTAEPAIPLPGGQGTSWRAGAVVLKPADGEAADTARWLHAVSHRVEAGDLRLALPRATPAGQVVVDGWSATPWLAGSRTTRDWSHRADVARRFARAFAAVDPGTMPRRSDPWAVADRVSWGEEPGPPAPHPVADALPLPRPVRVSVVHGDVAGNVLTHPGLAPAVIDVTPYARPVEWSVAVLAVDAVGFEGAPASLLGTISADRDFPELVARAVVFRQVTDVLRGVAPDPAYRAPADWALARL